MVLLGGDLKEAETSKVERSIVFIVILVQTVPCPGGPVVFISYRDNDNHFFVFSLSKSV